MRFVLIHGSWHTGAAWSEVTSALEEHGHTVLAPTLPGNGVDADRTVTLAETCAHVVDAITEAGWDELVLVGHSLGGAIVQLVTQAIPDRVSRAVFVNAYVVTSGTAIFDHVPPSAAEGFASLAVDGELMLPFEVFRDGFINDADLETARRAYEQLSPEPMARAMEPVDVSGFEAGDVPRSYVHLTDDNVFPATEFSWHPGMSSRLGPFRLVQVPGSHELMFSAPDRLAEAIVAAGRP